MHTTPYKALIVLALLALPVVLALDVASNKKGGNQDENINKYVFDAFLCDPNCCNTTCCQGPFTLPTGCVPLLGYKYRCIPNGIEATSYFSGEACTGDPFFIANWTADECFSLRFLGVWKVGKCRELRDADDAASVSQSVFKMRQHIAKSTLKKENLN